MNESFLSNTSRPEAKLNMVFHFTNIFTFHSHEKEKNLKKQLQLCTNVNIKEQLKLHFKICKISEISNVLLKYPCLFPWYTHIFFSLNKYILCIFNDSLLDNIHLVLWGHGVHLVRKTNTKNIRYNWILLEQKHWLEFWNVSPHLSSHRDFWAFGGVVSKQKFIRQWASQGQRARVGPGDPIPNKSLPR